MNTAFHGGARTHLFRRDGTAHCSTTDVERELERQRALRAELAGAFGGFCAQSLPPGETRAEAAAIAYAVARLHLHTCAERFANARHRDLQAWSAQVKQLHTELREIERKQNSAGAAPGVTQAGECGK